MLLKAKDIKVGMHLAHGEVIRSDSQLNAWVIITADGFDRKQRYLLPDAELEVTAVLGKHVKQGMHLKFYGLVEDVADYRGTVRIRSYPDRYFILSPEKSYPLSTKTDPVKGVDAHKHLLWAVQHKDWAQARAALTELEKQA